MSVSTHNRSKVLYEDTPAGVEFVDELGDRKLEASGEQCINLDNRTNLATGQEGMVQMSADKKSKMPTDIKWEGKICQNHSIHHRLTHHLHELLLIHGGTETPLYEDKKNAPKKSRNVEKSTEEPKNKNPKLKHGGWGNGLRYEKDGIQHYQGSGSMTFTRENPTCTLFSFTKEMLNTPPTQEEQEKYNDSLSTKITDTSPRRVIKDIAHYKPSLQFHLKFDLSAFDTLPEMKEGEKAILEPKQVAPTGQMYYNGE